MHWQALQFVSSIRQILPEFFIDKSVLEVGSHSVNGSVRSLFNDGNYTGIDLSEGDGVDQVISGHEFKSDECFDVTISCECFEHNPYYLETFTNMLAHTKEQGIIVFTCASDGRPEHGTSRTDPRLSPGTSSLSWDYYQNLNESHFNSLELVQALPFYMFLKNETSHDLYFIGTKSPELAAMLKDKQLQLEKQNALFCLLSERLSSGEKLTTSDLLTLFDTRLCPDVLFLLYRSQRELINCNIDKFESLVFQMASVWRQSAEMEYLLSESHLRAAKLDLALHNAKVSADFAQGREFFLYHYACVLQMNNQYLTAVDVIKKIRDYQRKAPLLRLISINYTSAEKLDKALCYIDLAIEQENDNVILFNQKRIVLHKLGQLDLAISFAQQIISNSLSPQWLLNTANQYVINTQKFLQNIK